MSTPPPTPPLSEKSPPMPPEGHVPLEPKRYTGSDPLFRLLQRYMDADLPPLPPDRVAALLHEEAMRRVAREALEEYIRDPGAYEALGVQTLQEVLERPEEPLEWRIEELLISEHNTTLAAPAKGGKTTLMVNLLRALVDESPFLGRFHVTKPLQGRIAMWNYELSERQMHSWLRSAEIKHPDRVAVLNLRGRGLFLQDNDACEWAVEWLRQAETELWVIDPLQAGLRGTVNSDETAGEWISNVERVKAEAGVSDLIVVTHTGHLSKADETGRAGNERTIGSARWQGWPDNMWTYVKDDEQVRYLRAVGRDVDVDEFALDFDKETLTLSYKGEDTSRQDQRQTKAWRTMLDALRADPDGLHAGSVLREQMKGSGSERTAAMRQAVDIGLLDESKRGQAKYYALTPLGRRLIAQP